MIKTILILADETRSFEVTLTSAVELGRRFAAYLDVLHVRSDPFSALPLAAEGFSAVMIEEIKKAEERALSERERKARAAYDRYLAEAGISASWRVAIGWKPDIAAAAARLSDLVLIARQSDSDETSWRKTLEAVLFNAGGPVLLLPREQLPIFGERVAVAWNGSAQSARAVTAALPFLRVARNATVLSAGAIDPYASTAGLLTHLARHEVRAEAREFETESISIGKALLDQAHVSQASLLVMGAYGHSRLHEVILGSATSEILSSADLPVLMAH